MRFFYEKIYKLPSITTTKIQTTLQELELLFNAEINFIYVPKTGTLSRLLFSNARSGYLYNFIIFKILFSEQLSSYIGLDHKLFIKKNRSNCASEVDLKKLS